MHAISFLYWFYGGIEAGLVSSIERGSDTAEIVLNHIGLVEELNEYIDSQTKEPLETIFQIKGLISFNGLSSANTIELKTIIKVLIDNYENKPRTCAAYYFQGAFELRHIDYVRIYQSKIADFPDCDLMEKLKFLFQITGQSYLSKDMNANLKVYVDNIFTHVIDKQKLDNIKYKASTTSLPNGGRLKPVDQIEPPDENDRRLEILC
jgi:hypothetical protein